MTCGVSWGRSGFCSIVFWWLTSVLLFSMRGRIRQRGVVAAAFRGSWQGPGIRRNNAEYSNRKSYGAGWKGRSTSMRQWCSSLPRHCQPADGADDRDEEKSLALQEQFLGSIEHSLTRGILPQLAATTETIDNLVLLLGVSGGCDSVALLHALKQILHANNGVMHISGPHGGKFLPCQLSAVHFDHKQRGAESDSDCRFVQKLCGDLRVPCQVYEWQNGAPFSQDRARRWRQESMQSLLESMLQSSSTFNTAGLILTAHHKDDSTETLLMKLLRGAHITNLAGMEALSNRDDHTFGYARPMLDLRKKDIVQFLRVQHLPWREDASNLSDKYLRNRVRNELVPLLGDLVGGEEVMQKRLDHLSEQSMEVRKDLESRASDYLAKQRDKSDERVFELPFADDLSLLKKEALYHWAENQGCAMSYDQIQRVSTQLADHPGHRQWTLNVGGGWNIFRNGSVLSLTSESGSDLQEELNHEEQTVEWVSTWDGNETEQKGRLRIRLPEFPLNHENITFFTSNAGSRRHLTFVPPWRERPVKIREFLRGQKIPLHLRNATIVLCLRTAGIAEEKAVAVLVDGEWIVASEFTIDNHETGSIVLLKIS